MTGWQEVSLKSVTSIIGDGLHGTPKYEPNGAYHFVNGNNLDGRKIVFNDTTKRCSEEEYLKYKKNLSDRTILLSINGTIGNLALYNNEKVILGKSACYFNVLENVDKLFVYYVAKDKEFQNYITSLATGSTIKNVGLKLVRDYHLKLPPITEQRAIAAVLGALDDKIELNSRVNSTLEAAARALFKSWFVDFDPVKAKMESRAPFGMDAATTALFPARLTESELGDIPDGWKMETLGKIADNPRAIVQPHKLSSATPYIGLEHMPRRCIALTDWGQADDVSSHKSAFVRGDFLFGKLRPYFHKVGIAAIDGISSTDIAIVRSRQQEFYAFTLSVISSDDFVEYTSQLSNGAKMPRINWSDMEKYKLVLPPLPIASAYNAAIGPMLEQIIASIYENHSLSKLRDYLLPKLISGEIRIPDAEKFVGGMV